MANSRPAWVMKQDPTLKKMYIKVKYFVPYSPLNSSQHTYTHTHTLTHTSIILRIEVVLLSIVVRIEWEIRNAGQHRS
jgi:hypothetical protein